MVLTLGIDVGSSFIKTALVEYGDHPKVINITNERIQKRNPTVIINKAVENTLAQFNLKYEDLVYVASTGEGELV